MEFKSVYDGIEGSNIKDKAELLDSLKYIDDIHNDTVSWLYEKNIYLNVALLLNLIMASILYAFYNKYHLKDNLKCTQQCDALGPDSTKNH